MNPLEAYRWCEEVTRTRAGNFYYGIRLLPPPKRRALCAVYAFARRVDDIGDGTLGPPEKLARLGELRAALAELDPFTTSGPAPMGRSPGGPGGPSAGPAADPSSDPVLLALGHAAAHYPLPRAALDDLLDGVEMDVRGASYVTFADLEAYCRKVAGSVGRLSVAVFGVPEGQEERAAGLADDLGVAMQITNVLRDLREDRARGRTYLPREDLVRFGCHPDPLGAPSEALRALVRFEAARARSWFGRGLGLLALLDPRSASCVSAMTGIYRRILDRLERRPEEAAVRRVSLPPWEKAWVAARSLAEASARPLARSLAGVGS